MTKEEEFSQYMSQIEYYKEQITSLETQQSYVQAAINDYSRARLTIEHLEKSENTTDVLLPIGGSTYIDAKTNNTSKVLFDIGSGLVIEKKTDDAIKKIDNRIKDLEKNQEKIQQIMQQVQNDANEITVKAQKLYSEIQQGK